MCTKREEHILRREIRQLENSKKFGTLQRNVVHVTIVTKQFLFSWKTLKNGVTFVWRKPGFSYHREHSRKYLYFFLSILHAFITVFNMNNEDKFDWSQRGWTSDPCSLRILLFLCFCFLFFYFYASVFFLFLMLRVYERTLPCCQIKKFLHIFEFPRVQTIHRILATWSLNLTNQLVNLCKIFQQITKRLQYHAFLCK